MTVYYIIFWTGVFLFGVSAVWGLAWAIRTGQMDDFRRGAASIFDDDEPVGETTDAFPREGRGKPGC